MILGIFHSAGFIFRFFHLAGERLSEHWNFSLVIFCRPVYNQSGNVAALSTTLKSNNFANSVSVVNLVKLLHSFCHLHCSQSYFKAQCPCISLLHLSTPVNLHCTVSRLKLAPSRNFCLFLLYTTKQTQALL